MFNKFIVGNEKSIIGATAAGIVSLLGQVGVSGQMTLKEAIYSLVTALFTHLTVWTSTNTAKVVPTMVVPTDTVSDVSSPPMHIPIINADQSSS